MVRKSCCFFQTKPCLFFSSEPFIHLLHSVAFWRNLNAHHHLPTVIIIKVLYQKNFMGKKIVLQFPPACATTCHLHVESFESKCCWGGGKLPANMFPCCDLYLEQKRLDSVLCFWCVSIKMSIWSVPAKCKHTLTQNNDYRCNYLLSFSSPLCLRSLFALLCSTFPPLSLFSLVFCIQLNFA